MIQPGLARISKLLANTALPWRAIHVAGTNGKGSICNYVASMFDAYNASRLRGLTAHKPLSWGKFTSPHLIDRWDGISVYGQTISPSHFEHVEDRMHQTDIAHDVEASEFEILTATAFEIFTSTKVDIGIVEVGMGGALDATNIIGQPDTNSVDPVTRAMPLVTAIAKIGLDHQSFLGSSIEEIAAQKAGIIKPGAPLVYDESNLDEVKAVFDTRAAEIGTIAYSLQDIPLLAQDALQKHLPIADSKSAAAVNEMPAHVRQNLNVALRSAWLSLSQLGRLQKPDAIPSPVFSSAIQDLAVKMASVADTRITPNHGRLERLHVTLPENGSSFHGKSEGKLLLDGAHNAQAAAALAIEVDRLRTKAAIDSGAVNWLVAVSLGRDVKELLQPLLRSGDHIYVVEFSPVADMPWVKPTQAADLMATIAELVDEKVTTIHMYGKNCASALRAALATSEHRWTIVTGSLYLIGDIHKLLKTALVRPIHH